ncbi:MAG TPA: acyl-CoA dehydrogenase, partial [Acidimicrobiales bacterium]|nr:acyl-CoA dehydrogenase [Acidimicrobiales bacterium]
MGIAITEDHLQLAAVARAFLQGHDALGAARAALAAPVDELPSFWKEAAGLGWLGLHLPEAAGGSGFGLDELAVVVAEFGRQAAPGPFLSTVIASAVVAAHGSTDQRAAALPGLADGSRVAGVGLGGSLVLRDGLLAGDGGLVVSAEVADVLLLPVGDDMVLVDRHLGGVSVGPTSGSLDRGRRVAAVTLAGCRVSSDNVLAGARSHAVQIARALAAAEAAGGASACVDMASEYAKIRVAFDRPIGQFQAIKHHCANMLAQAELATAAAWDAARAASVPDEAELPTAVAAAVAFPAFLLCANKNMQVHGGIGFTYAHDCHLYFRRAMSLMALFGPVEAAREQVLAAALSGARATAHLDPPEGSDELRTEVRAFAERYHALPEEERRGALLESGYLLPHWPKPWGRAATPAQQLVIDQELAGV